MAAVTADQIRRAVERTHIAPARARGEWRFSVRLGDVRKMLPGIRGNSHIRSAIVSPAKFLEPNGLAVVAESGPASGQGSNTIIAYEFRKDASSFLDELKALYGSFQGMGLSDEIAKMRAEWEERQ